MKKFISVFTLVFLILSMSVTNTYASGDISVDIVYSAEENTLTVSGNVPYERNRIPMTLQIKRSGVIVGVAETLAVTKTADGVSYSFLPVKISSSTRSGTLTVDITASMINMKKSVTFNYKGIDSQLEALKMINSLGTLGDTSGMNESFALTSSDLSVTEADLSNLSEKGKEAFAKHLISCADYTLPANCDTEENCDTIREAVVKYQKDVKEALAIARFFSLSSQNGIKEWFDLYGDEYNLADNTETVNEYINFAVNSSGFVNRCNQLEGAKDMTELKALFIEQAVLENIESSNYTVVGSIISEFSNILGINYSKWNSLGSDTKANVILKSSGKNYKTFAEFSNSINSIMEEQTQVVRPGGSMSSGSSGSSSGSFGGFQIKASTDIVSKPAESGLPFVDIAEVSWAQEAVRYLYTNKIISGKSETTFAPSDYVTRAELAKMIALAFNLPASSVGLGFNDVDASMWYAPYVSQVSASGIVLGDDKGNFNPLGPVTRQDTLVMLYRALGAPFADKQAYFEDYADISDYAKSAVDYMCSNGVVNGVGDGMFAPKLSLTRAEAAKIIYNILTK